MENDPLGPVEPGYVFAAILPTGGGWALCFPWHVRAPWAFVRTDGRTWQQDIVTALVGSGPDSFRPALTGALGKTRGIFCVSDSSVWSNQRGESANSSLRVTHSAAVWEAACTRPGGCATQARPPGPSGEQSGSCLGGVRTRRNLLWGGVWCGAVPVCIPARTKLLASSCHVHSSCSLGSHKPCWPGCSLHPGGSWGDAPGPPPQTEIYL